MELLFPDMAPALPPVPGLAYVPEFLSMEEHDELLREIDQEQWISHWQRRIQVYGERYGSSPEGKPLPSWGVLLAERLYERKLMPFLSDQVYVNEYLPGQGIAPHVDYDPYDRAVASISLGSACLIDFKSVERTEEYNIWLEPRSVLIMEGEARYKWKHGIAARKKDNWNGMWLPRHRRVSITFRKKL